MREFGPRRRIDEPSSRHYWRWARFCLAWAAGAALLLAAAVIGLRQEPGPGWPTAGLTFLALLGGFGLGMGGLAALGYLASAGLARLAEAGPPPHAHGYRRFVMRMSLLMLGWTLLQGWIGIMLLPEPATTASLLPPPFSLLIEHPQPCALWALGWLATSALILLAWARRARRRYDLAERQRLAAAAAEQLPFIHQAIARHEKPPIV